MKILYALLFLLTMSPALAQESSFVSTPAQSQIQSLQNQIQQLEQQHQEDQQVIAIWQRAYLDEAQLLQDERLLSCKRHNSITACAH